MIMLSQQVYDEYNKHKKIESHGEPLYNKVFEDLSPFEIQDENGVTCYEESVSYIDGWYAIYDVSFRYGGYKYGIEKKEHTSDNVDDSSFRLNSFCYIIERDEMSSEINKIINYIEEEKYISLNQIVKDLEGLKKLADKMNQ